MMQAVKYLQLGVPGERGWHYTDVDARLWASMGAPRAWRLGLHLPQLGLRANDDVLYDAAARPAEGDLAVVEFVVSEVPNVRFRGVRRVHVRRGVVTADEGPG